MITAQLIILIVALVFYCLSIFWAVSRNEYSAVWFAVMSAVTLYVLGASLVIWL